MSAPPQIIQNKHYTEPTVFTPENLLREARRQKSLSRVRVPRLCVLDPDGDIVRWLIRERGVSHDPEWACYHTDLYRFSHAGMDFGIIGCAVGAAFAVLVAEELFASGCGLLISMTSAGQITATAETPYFVLIDKALRDEGTSYHYLPASDYSHLSPVLRGMLVDVFRDMPIAVHGGATWTTDAPFRETESAIARNLEMGVLAVEMEAAALYAFAEARHKAVVCFAHVTNQMALAAGDFAKGADDGCRDALRIISLTAHIWLSKSMESGSN